MTYRLHPNDPLTFGRTSNPEAKGVLTSDNDSNVEPSSEETFNGGEINWSELTKKELQSELDKREIEWTTSLNKAELISLLEGE